MDKVEGHLEVGHNERGEIVINHPDLKPDADGVGHIVFSVNQAEHLSALLLRHAREAACEMRDRKERAAREAAAAVPVNRGDTMLTDGSPVTEDHRDIIPSTGQQKGYVVLSDAERARGFVRPLRYSYIHKTCGSLTTMGRKIAETHARDPKFYGGTFCCTCGTHRPLAEFRWEGTDEMVGS